METPFVCRSEFGNILRIPIVVMFSAIIICGLFLKEFFNITFIVFGMCMIALFISWYVISYKFNDNEFVVKVPLQTLEIIYTSVTRITVPGLNDIIQGSSTRSIGIYYGTKSYVCISPVNRDDVIMLLRKKCPCAKYEDLRSDH